MRRSGSAAPFWPGTGRPEPAVATGSNAPSASDVAGTEKSRRHRPAARADRCPYPGRARETADIRVTCARQTPPRALRGRPNPRKTADPPPDGPTPAATSKDRIHGRARDPAGDRRSPQRPPDTRPRLVHGPTRTPLRNQPEFDDDHRIRTGGDVCACGTFSLHQVCDTYNPLVLTRPCLPKRPPRPAGDRRSPTGRPRTGDREGAGRTLRSARAGHEGGPPGR